MITDLPNFALAGLLFFAAHQGIKLYWACWLNTQLDKLGEDSSE